MRARVPGSVAWGLAPRLPSASRSFWKGPVGPGRAARRDRRGQGRETPRPAARSSSRRGGQTGRQRGRCPAPRPGACHMQRNPPLSRAEDVAQGPEKGLLQPWCTAFHCREDEATRPRRRSDTESKPQVCRARPGFKSTTAWLCALGGRATPTGRCPEGRSRRPAAGEGAPRTTELAPKGKGRHSGPTGSPLQGPGTWALVQRGQKEPGEGAHLPPGDIVGARGRLVWGGGAPLSWAPEGRDGDLAPSPEGVMGVVTVSSAVLRGHAPDCPATAWGPSEARLPGPLPGAAPILGPRWGRRTVRLKRRAVGPVVTSARTSPCSVGAATSRTRAHAGFMDS